VGVGVVVEVTVVPFTVRIKSQMHLLINSRTEAANQRRGSEWEQIKILFKNSAYESNFTQAPPQTSLAKST
jgi:hypothetical protein